MRAAAAARRLLLLEAAAGTVLTPPTAARLFTSTPAASRWRQVLKAAASMLPLGGDGDAASVDVAAPQAAPGQAAMQQSLAAQQLQQLHSPEAAEPQNDGSPAGALLPAAAAAVAAAAAGSAPWLDVRPHLVVSGNGSDISRRALRRGKKAERAAKRAAEKAGKADLAASGAARGAAAAVTLSGEQLEQHDSKETAGQLTDDSPEPSSSSSTGACALPPTLILQDDAHPIREEDISRPAWFVLSRLRSAGHEAYVVGGTVRDLLLGGTPKDYDLLTSAEPHQIKKLFSRCIVVGRSFPVCQVYAEGMMLEVSSFSTNADSSLIPADASVHMIGRQKPKRWSREGATWAAARADNAVRRDFTVNGLFYDPFSRLLFDSVGGVADCTARRLRTICAPGESFSQDPARILRGVRLAARADLEICSVTAEAMAEQAATIGQLPQGRLHMELSSLLGYGAAERSLALMWRLGVLDMLLPQQALYLRRHRVPRAPRKAARSPRRHDLLFELAAELDKHVHPQRPVDPSVWVALIAAPLVGEQCATLTKRRHDQQAQAAARAAAKAAAEAGDGNSNSSSSSESDSSSSSSESEGEVDDGQAPAEGAADAITAVTSELLDGTEEEEGDTPHVEVHRPRLLAGGALPAEQQQRLEYVEQYGQIVSDVLDSMLQPLDAEMMTALGRQSKRRGQELQGTAPARGRKKQKRPSDGLLPCVLPRAAADRAAALLMLEADLRGRPELRLLLERSGWPAHGRQESTSSGGASGGGLQPGSGNGNGSGEPAVGRHHQQHHLWQRLERVALGGEEAAEAAAADAGRAAAAEPSRFEPPQPRGRKHGKGRVLSAEERLVLGILSDPCFDFATRTALPGGGD